MSESEVNFKAEQIMTKLGASGQYREFYCRAVWRLPESTIQGILEKALNKGKDPAKYFSYLVSREAAYRC